MSETKKQLKTAAASENLKSDVPSAGTTNSLSVIAATYDDDCDSDDQNSYQSADSREQSNPTVVGNQMIVSNEQVINSDTDTANAGLQVPVYNPELVITERIVTDDSEPVIVKEQVTIPDPGPSVTKKITDPELTIIREQITISDSRNKNYRVQDSDNSDSEDDSSSSDSSNSSSSSSSSSSSDSDDDHDSDGTKKQSSNKNRKKKGNPERGEYDDLPPIENVQISVPEVLCDPMGEVGWIVEQMVVVTPKANKPTLNFDTMLFVDKGKRALGRVFDVFGPVTEPHYCVRFNNAQHIKESDIKVGMTVYYCPNTPYTTLVFMTDLLKIKATDDVGEDEHPEFSDDEQEKAYFASLKQRQRNNSSSGSSNNNKKSNDTNRSTPSSKRQKKNDGWKSQHPWSSARKTGAVSQNNYWYQQQAQAQAQAHFYSQPQQNTWASYPSNVGGNPWDHYSYQNWFSPQSQYSPATSYQPNVDLTPPPGPSFPWQANSTFTPTPTNVPWHMPPPPPPPPSYLPSTQQPQSPSSPAT
ncbi:H/ACA ribonucleoprotein complex non-core subunit NAF1 [Microplitis demolitor]|uniref:H/ACA ribonucleoprotein complex non-core subunit NAF1 n=1 Tax=Microplitis demolitor TaxID=69319 RepID=UPI0004CCE3FA|nr:H/ACA ribonucleoprotein complex non-core subunit NAF1 [Microplitis demolitor]